MKNRKINGYLVVALIVTGILAAQVTSAQGARNSQNKTPEERAQILTEWMKTKLQLDSMQVSRVQAINLTYAQKNAPILKSGSGKLAKFKKLKALQQQKDGELKKVFSAEQCKQYEALQDEMKEKMKEKRS